jgi:hypothetical protein
MPLSQLSSQLGRQSCWVACLLVLSLVQSHTVTAAMVSIIHIQALTVDVIDLEEELDLVVWRLSGELVHGVQELLEGDGTAVVLVEDLEHPLHEEGLQNTGGKVSENGGMVEMF